MIHHILLFFLFLADLANRITVECMRNRNGPVDQKHHKTDHQCRADLIHSFLSGAAVQHRNLYHGNDNVKRTRNHSVKSGIPSVKKHDTDDKRNRSHKAQIISVKCYARKKRYHQKPGTQDIAYPAVCAVCAV